MNQHLITLLAMLLGLQTTCIAIDLPQKVKTSDSFTLYMPSDWISIPKDVLDAKFNEVFKNAPETKAKYFEYGFQLSASQNWLDYPYILIKVGRTGRIPEGQVKSTKQVSQSVKSNLDKEKDALSSYLSNARVGEIIYDPQTHILWSQLVIDTKVLGTVRCLCGTLLTEEGIIEIYAYALEQDFPHYLPTFEAIIRNTVIADNLRYKPRFIDSTPVVGSIDWPKVFGAAITGAIIALLYRGRKKKGDLLNN